jgi:hypothetical protein
MHGIKLGYMFGVLLGFLHFRFSAVEVSQLRSKKQQIQLGSEE